MTGRPHRFILQAIHPEFACPTFETMFAVARLEDLQALLGPDAQDDPQLDQIYWLELEDIAAITQRFGVPFDAHGCEVTLGKYAERDEQIPYLVHTGYELPLMLDGRKKLARLYYEYPPHWHPYEEQFDRFVAQCLLHKEVDVEPFDRPIRTASGKVFDGLRTAYYTPKGEEWRMQAFRLLEKAQAKGGWNDTLERLEGMLYGYEDWQTDWWADYRRRKLSLFGTILVYAALSPVELAAVEFSGFRTLPKLDRPLLLISSSDDDLSENERRQLTQTLDQSSLIRFRVNARPFLDLREAPQARMHCLRADQIKDVNELLLEKIEIVTNGPAA
ncbi:MAG TPA: hypothetical protein VLA02_07895 [Reyranella sp.]|nr:hypothetical protein [Reyranella sp.]